MKGGAWIQRTADEISTRYARQAHVHPQIGNRKERQSFSWYEAEEPS